MTVWPLIAEEISRFRAEIRDLAVSPHSDPAVLGRAVEERYDFSGPRPLDELVGEVMKLLREHIVHVTHPRYFGLFNPSVREAGIAGDALAALYNPQLGVWSHAPAAYELERITLCHFAKALGLDPDTTLATFTTGGSEANLSAVLAALAARCPEVDQHGLGALSSRPLIYLSEEGHHSFVKIARMCGLGTGALRFLATDDSFSLDWEAAGTRIRADREAGFLPLMLVATAGTTACGAIDPLERLAELAAAEDVWLHVDAAWGGAAALSDRLRSCLAGVEQADSVTWDAHKWLSVPMGAGMFFCSHPEAVRRAFAVRTSYMPAPTERAVDDFYATSVQWSRRSIGLKVFLSLAELGSEGYAALIDRQAESGDRLRQKLTIGGWTVVNRTPLPLVCFTHPRIREGELTAREVVRSVQEGGRAWISEVNLGGETVLRACITSYWTDEDDLDVLLDELERALSRSGGRLPRGESRQGNEHGF